MNMVCSLVSPQGKYMAWSEQLVIDLNNDSGKVVTFIIPACLCLHAMANRYKRSLDEQQNQIYVCKSVLLLCLQEPFVHMQLMAWGS